MLKAPPAAKFGKKLTTQFDLGEAPALVLSSNIRLRTYEIYRHILAFPPIEKPTLCSDRVIWD